MPLTPERLETLKNQHGLDADEAQELFTHVETLEDDATKVRELIDLLIETCPESHQTIATFAHNVVHARKA